jgi:deoxyribodipyrimidine photolyase-related protein
MRHFAEELRAKKIRLEYRRLEAPDNRGDLKDELLAAIEKFKPKRVVVLEPGEYRIEVMLREVAQAAPVELEIRRDRYFFCSRAEFGIWAKAHKQLRMEFFYREMRKRTGVLMEGSQPIGRWNFDTENRESFGKQGPGLLMPTPMPFPPDKITSEVIALVENKFGNHPGSLAHFCLPVTAKDARVALDDFLRNRLADFGAYQDAMWTDTPFLYHSRLSATMNLKLLDPHVVVKAVETEYKEGKVPLASAEGYIRQILGWREYVRGVYWHFMPDYIERNALDAHEKLPDFYWDGRTDMNCLKQAVGETLEYGYAHHIQRLMVTGLYALLFGVEPVEVHKWYLAIYWDAVEWVEMPNVTGLSQFADGGVMGSKPYIASGKYINRMSNYCEGCRYKPEEATGASACPFTTLYWDFLMRHEEKLAANVRMRMQVRNLQRLSPAKKTKILEQAGQLRASTPKGSY